LIHLIYRNKYMSIKMKNVYRHHPDAGVPSVHTQPRKAPEAPKLGEKVNHKEASLRGGEECIQGGQLTLGDRQGLALK
jgi:hypothetical protein